MVLAAGDTTQTGQTIFVAKCAQCHGKDAKGNPKMVNLLGVDPALMDLTACKLKPKEILLLVTNGKQKMPKWKSLLTKQQIKSVVDYVKILMLVPTNGK